MKRKFAILLIMCMTVSLVACNSGKSNSEVSNISVNTESDFVEEVTLETLKELFSINIEIEGLSSEEMYIKGSQYENGEGVVQWYGMAMAYYEAAKEAGSEDALIAIDDLNLFKEELMSYENSPEGQGEIFTFFRTGVSAGQAGDFESAYAIYHDDTFFFEDPLIRGLGELAALLEKDGTEESMQTAIAIHRYNAEVIGKGKSYSSIGSLYKAEEGTYQAINHSMDKAIEYYENAYMLESLSQVDEKAPRYLADIYSEGYIKDDGTTIDPNYEKAVECYIIAADMGDTTSCYKLAVYYQNGIGINQDYEKSAEFYLKAIDGSHSTQLGIPQCYLALGQYYEGGIGVDIDIEEAIRYYTEARDAAKDNLDLVNVGASNLDMESIRDEAIEALERLEK